MRASREGVPEVRVWILDVRPAREYDPSYHRHVSACQQKSKWYDLPAITMNTRMTNLNTVRSWGGQVSEVSVCVSKCFSHSSARHRCAA